MKKDSRGAVSTLFFLVMLVIAALTTLVIAATGTLYRLNRTNTMPSNVIAASQETFEITENAGADTLKAEGIDFNADNIKTMQDNDVKNILLIGQDMRSTSSEARERSDTMIICSINTRTNEITLTSLMRDLYVQIPGYSNNRMNAAYYFGGMELLDQVVAANFGINIDGNVVIDLEGFISAIAKVGSLDIELTEEEAEYMNSNQGLGYAKDIEDFKEGEEVEQWFLEEGVNSLNSEQILCYCRMRHVGNSDWERTERQRRVIMAAFQKVRASGYGSMYKVANAVIPYVITDMTNSEIMSYVKTVAVEDIKQINSYRIPVEGYYSSETINGMAVLVPDLTMNSQYLQYYIYGTEIDESLAGQYNPLLESAEEEYTEETYYEEPYYEEPYYEEPYYGGSYVQEPYYDDQAGMQTDEIGTPDYGYTEEPVSGASAGDGTDWTATQSQGGSESFSANYAGTSAYDAGTMTVDQSTAG